MASSWKALGGRENLFVEVVNESSLALVGRMRRLAFAACVSSLVAVAQASVVVNYDADVAATAGTTGSVDPTRKDGAPTDRTPPSVTETIPPTAGGASRMAQHSALWVEVAGNYRYIPTYNTVANGDIFLDDGTRNIQITNTGSNLSEELGAGSPPASYITYSLTFDAGTATASLTDSLGAVMASLRPMGPPQSTASFGARPRAVVRDRPLGMR